MTSEFASPSIDPANRHDIAGTIRLILAKFLQGVDDMLPAKVIAYDRATNMARVQPLITVVTMANEVVQRAQVASVPVLQIGGGGFVLSFPLTTGDLGWIKANDRDISLFKQIMAQAAPNTQRKHSFEDAVFIPDSMMRSVVIDPEDAANVVLQTLDGTVRVSIWSDKVKVTAPEVQIVASTSITLDAPVTTITGALAAGGVGGAAATFSGSITATGEVTSGTIPLTTHKHTGVQTGGSNTGNPVP